MIVLAEAWNEMEMRRDMAERQYRKFGLTREKSPKTNTSPQETVKGFLEKVARYFEEGISKQLRKFFEEDFFENFIETMKKEKEAEEEMKRFKIIKDHLYSRVYSPVIKDFYNRF